MSEFYFEAAKRRPKVYISGAMTGKPDLNFPAFNAAEDHLARLGFRVHNPATKGQCYHDNGDEWSWREYLTFDLARLLKCDAIALLPGWEDSRGAKLELMVATQLGLLIIDLPEVSE